MERRTALKIVALSTLAPKLVAAEFPTRCHLEPEAAWTPSTYKLQFFTEAENDLLDRLMEMIIPEDSHSPGAHAARVSLFADLMVGTSDNSTQQLWRNGLVLIREEAQKSSLAEALAQAAAASKAPASPLGNFFVALKQMTVDGYYTSEIGIHQDLGYVGNTYLSAFPGCNHPEHD
jgi:hypothetical protein